MAGPRCCVSGSRNGGVRTALLGALVVASWLAQAQAQPSTVSPPQASLITAITPLTMDDGRTVIEVVGDAEIAAERCRHLRLHGGSPRVVLKIQGIRRAYRRSVIAVEDGNVHRVRTGFHNEVLPPELHLVIDLVDDQVELISLVHAGNRLRLELSHGDAAAADADQGAAELGGSTEPEQSDSPPAQPSEPDLDGAQVNEPEVLPSAPQQMPTAVPSVPAPRPVVISTPAPLLIKEVMILEQPEGSQVVVKADREFAPFSVRELQFSGYPPRYALTVENAHLGEVPELIPVSSTTLRQLRLIVYEDRQPPQVQLLLELASATVQVSPITRQGTSLSVRLTRAE